MSRFLLKSRNQRMQSRKFDCKNLNARFKILNHIYLGHFYESVFLRVEGLQKVLTCTTKHKLVLHR